ncbi:hybrid signal transduction histidine kinase M [Tanacetum coccineum]
MEATLKVDSSPPISEWLKIDSILLSWIFVTLSKAIQARLRSRSIALKAELRSLKLGDLTIDAYFRKIDQHIELTTLSCASLRAYPISKPRDIVNIALIGFRILDKYEMTPILLFHREPFPDLKMVHSMLTTTKMWLKSMAQATTLDSSSSSPMVFWLTRGIILCVALLVLLVRLISRALNFACGFCRFGDSCRYMHGGTNVGVNENNSLWSTSTNSPTSSLTASTMNPKQIMALIQLQQALLAIYGWDYKC